MALALLGARGLHVLAVAPAVTAAILGSGALAAPLIGLTWSPWVALGLTAVVAGLAWLLGRGQTWRLVSPDRRDASLRRWVLPAAVVGGTALQLVPLAVGMGRPDRVQNAWDALFHLAAVQQVRAGGGAAPAALNELAGGPSGYYPHGWHAVAGLVPWWGEPVVAVNVVAFVPCAVATALGVAALARAAFPARVGVPAVAALLVGSGVVLPLAVAVQPGLIPYALGAALLPGVLAMVVDIARGGQRQPVRLVVVVVAASGVALVHPAAAAALALLALPWVVPAGARALARVWTRPSMRAPVALAFVLVVVGSVVVLTSPTVRHVASIDHKPDLGLAELLERLVTGDLGEWSAYPLVTTLLALGGATVLASRPDGRPIAVALVLALGTYSAAASSWDVLSTLTALWYSETRRVAPLVGVLVVVVAAWALVEGAHRVVRRIELPRGMGVSTASGAVVLVVVALTTVHGVSNLRAAVADAFDQDMPANPGAFDRKPYLTEAEDAMLARLATELDHDALLLGSSLSGAGHLAALTGQRVVQPYHSTSLGEDVRYVSDHLPDLRTDPVVCALVRRLDARYVYVDPYPLHSTYWSTTYAGSFTEPPPGRPLDTAGAAAVYPLDACFADG